MRLLILSWKDPRDADAGGAERYLARIASWWVERGHSVTMITPRRDGVRDYELVNKIQFQRLGNRHSVFPLARGHLARHGDGYDHVLESVSTRPFLAHHVVGDRATALYHQMADDVWNQEFRFPVSWLGRHMIEPRWVRAMRGARIVAVSPSTAADLARHGLATLATIPPGCDPFPAARARTPPSEAPRFIHIGRLVRAKRTADALRAFHIVRQRMPRSHFDVVGDGYRRGTLQRHAGPGVSIHGYVSDEEKAQLLDGADVMLIPGTREGWGIIAMEAAAHGIPVVAYDVPGLRDSVVDGVTGHLCQSNPRAMADATFSILHDSSRFQTMSRSAIEWAGRHTWERAVSELTSLIERSQPHCGVSGEPADAWSTPTPPTSAGTVRGAVRAAQQ
ncbi:MAG: glycosyltransferase family 4 protein [Candidatus Dormibacteraeota bacterium]|nr:glycosyltransferase family 4 protein [Candidatus Dormibacteraeota bacterium]